MAQPVYRLFEKKGRDVDPTEHGTLTRKVAMQLAAALRRSGRNVYVRRVDIALTRQSKG